MRPAPRPPRGSLLSLIGAITRCSRWQYGKSVSPQRFVATGFGGDPNPCAIPYSFQELEGQFVPHSASRSLMKSVVLCPRLFCVSILREPVPYTFDQSAWGDRRNGAELEQSLSNIVLLSPGDDVLPRCLSWCSCVTTQLCHLLDCDRSACLAGSATPFHSLLCGLRQPLLNEVSGEYGLEPLWRLSSTEDQQTNDAFGHIGLAPSCSGGKSCLHVPPTEGLSKLR